MIPKAYKNSTQVIHMSSTKMFPLQIKRSDNVHWSELLINSLLPDHLAFNQKNKTPWH